MTTGWQSDASPRLIAEQFPQRAGLPVRPVGTQGTWRVNYRLGDDLVIRLPRVPDTGGSGRTLSKECCPCWHSSCPWKPELVGLGQPAAGYPSTWGVVRWIDGDVPVEGQLAAPDLLAIDLADFLRALWNVDLPGGRPADGGEPLSAFMSSLSGPSGSQADSGRGGLPQRLLLLRAEHPRGHPPAPGIGQEAD